MSTEQQSYQNAGFSDEQELHNLVLRLDLSSAKKIADFKRWQNSDGTKAGLLKLPCAEE